MGNLDHTPISTVDLAEGDPGGLSYQAPMSDRAGYPFGECRRSNGPVGLLPLSGIIFWAVESIDSNKHPEVLSGYSTRLSRVSSWRRISPRSARKAARWRQLAAEFYYNSKAGWTDEKLKDSDRVVERDSGRMFHHHNHRTVSRKPHAIGRGGSCTFAPRSGSKSLDKLRTEFRRPVHPFRRQATRHQNRPILALSSTALVPTASMTAAP